VAETRQNSDSSCVKCYGRYNTALRQIKSYESWKFRRFKL
jgi:hypothetical protein